MVKGHNLIFMGVAQICEKWHNSFLGTGVTLTLYINQGWASWIFCLSLLQFLILRPKKYAVFRNVGYK